MTLSDIVCQADLYVNWYKKREVRAHEKLLRHFDTIEILFLKFFDYLLRMVCVSLSLSLSNILHDIAKRESLKFRPDSIFLCVKI